MLNEATRRALLLLLAYLRPMAGRVTLLGLLVIGGIALQLINPQIIRAFIDSALAGGDQAVLLRAGLLFLAFAVIKQIFTAAAGYLSEDIGWRATNQLRANLAEHCLRLDLPFHHARTPGEMIERVDSDVGVLAEFFAQLVLQVVGNALLAVGILALLFREDWRFGLVGLGYTAGLLVFLHLMQNASVRFMAESRQADAELYGFIEEALVSTEDVTANGAVGYVLERFYRYMRRQFLAGRRSDVIVNGAFSGGFFLYVLGQAATLLISARLFLDSQITIGTVFLVIQYVDLMETPLNEIRRQVTQLHHALASLARIESFLARQPAVKSGTQAIRGGPLAVRFDGVTFAYGDHAPALSAVSFEIAPGEVMGLVGRTGSGKSTLIRLLFRLYDPAEGQIHLQGQEIRDVQIENLQRDIGLVTQEVQLFAATVRDNLSFFDPEVPDKRILETIETVGLGTWFARLPDGLDTALEGGGRGLSAGEAQLLALARVYLKDPRLVILDEPSSRLDPATEHQLQAAVDHLMEGRTGIIVAHRLSTLDRADSILILEEGKLLEHGRRASLSADPSTRYAHLLRLGQENLDEGAVETGAKR